MLGMRLFADLENLNLFGHMKVKVLICELDSPETRNTYHPFHSCRFNQEM